MFEFLLQGKQNSGISHELHRQDKEIRQGCSATNLRFTNKIENVSLGCHGFITSENSGAKLNFFKYYSA